MKEKEKKPNKLIEFIYEYRLLIKSITYGLLLTIVILIVFGASKYFDYKDKIQIVERCELLEDNPNAVLCCYGCITEVETESYYYLEEIDTCKCDDYNLWINGG